MYQIKLFIVTFATTLTASIAWTLFIGAIAAAPVMLLWNLAAAPALGLPAISYPQAYGIYILCRMLFGGTSSTGKSND